MVSRILAFRPASVMHRLAPRSGACPLSGREVLRPAAELGFLLPIVHAPIAAVARGALVAAKELGAALGIALPRRVPARPWFEGVTRAADELAAGLPVVLCAEVMVEGEGPPQIDRACGEVWALVDAGMTHLAIDVSAVAPEERGRVLGEVGQAAAEQGIGVEAVVPLGGGTQGGAHAAAMLEEAARRIAVPDAAGFRCPAAASDGEARLQAAALARMCQALAGVPVVRRGPSTPSLLALLRRSPVKACDDGGAAAARAVARVPALLARSEGSDGEGATRLARAPAELSAEGSDRLEASAYVDATDFLGRLGAAGSAASVVRALERSLEER